MDMSLSSLSLTATSINTNSDIGMAMVKKSMESMEQSGEGLRKMMEQSVNPNLGQHIDYSV